MEVTQRHMKRRGIHQALSEPLWWIESVDDDALGFLGVASKLDLNNGKRSLMCFDICGVSS
jgi:hypothetical protein